MRVVGPVHYTYTNMLVSYKRVPWRTKAKRHGCGLYHQHISAVLVIPNPSTTLRVNSARTQVAMDAVELKGPSPLLVIPNAVRTCGCRTLLQNGIEVNEATELLRCDNNPTHLIPSGVYPERSRRVRNDNTSFGAVDTRG